MNKLVLTILLCVSAHFALAQTSTITVTIEGINNTNGKIQIGLYSNKSDFGYYDKVFLGVASTPLKKKLLTPSKIYLRVIMPLPLGMMTMQIKKLIKTFSEYLLKNMDSL